MGSETITFVGYGQASATRFGQWVRVWNCPSHFVGYSYQYTREFQKTMTNKSLLVLVVTNLQSLKDGLLALMTTIPQINTVFAAERLYFALSLAKKHQPQVIILDTSLPGIRDGIKQIKAQCSHTHLIVLVEDLQEQKDVEKSGADSVLIKGFPAQKLIDIVEELIDQSESTYPNQEGGINEN